MTAIRKAAVSLTLFAAVGLLSAHAFADLLDAGPAYNDGATVWKGTTSFQSGDDPDLKGYVKWIVFDQGAFPFAGYAPTPGELTYAYQIYCTGSAALSNYSVFLENAADNLSWFSDPALGVTGVAPSATSGLVWPGSAWWDFTAIEQGQNSLGLVYSSPNKPEDFSSIVINHGNFSVAEPVPSPSPNPIPEPGTMLSLIAALCAFAAARGSRLIGRR
jgi:hypothetical protein